MLLHLDPRAIDLPAEDGVDDGRVLTVGMGDVRHDHRDRTQEFVEPKLDVGDNGGD